MYPGSSYQQVPHLVGFILPENGGEEDAEGVVVNIEDVEQPSYDSAVLSNFIEIFEESLEEGHMRPVLFHSDQSPLDIGTHPPRVVGSVGPLEVDPYFVEGDIFNLEIRSLLENVPTYNHPYMFSFY